MRKYAYCICITAFILMERLYASNNSFECSSNPEVSSFVPSPSAPPIECIYPCLKAAMMLEKSPDKAEITEAASTGISHECSPDSDYQLPSGSCIPPKELDIGSLITPKSSKVNLGGFPSLNKSKYVYFPCDDLSDATKETKHIQGILNTNHLSEIYKQIELDMQRYSSNKQYSDESDKNLCERISKQHNTNTDVVSQMPDNSSKEIKDILYRNNVYFTIRCPENYTGLAISAIAQEQDTTGLERGFALRDEFEKYTAEKRPEPTLAYGDAYKEEDSEFKRQLDCNFDVKSMISKTHKSYTYISTYIETSENELLKAVIAAMSYPKAHSEKLVKIDKHKMRVNKEMERKAAKTKKKLLERYLKYNPTEIILKKHVPIEELSVIRDSKPNTNMTGLYPNLLNEENDSNDMDCAVNKMSKGISEAAKNSNSDTIGAFPVDKNRTAYISCKFSIDTRVIHQEFVWLNIEAKKDFHSLCKDMVNEFYKKLGLTRLKPIDIQLADSYSMVCKEVFNVRVKKVSAKGYLTIMFCKNMLMNQ